MPATMAPIAMKQNTISSFWNATQFLASSALKKRAFHCVTATATQTRPSSAATTAASSSRPRTRSSERKYGIATARKMRMASTMLFMADPGLQIGRGGRTGHYRSKRGTSRRGELRCNAQSVCDKPLP